MVTGNGQMPRVTPTGRISATEDELPDRARYATKMIGCRRTWDVYADLSIDNILTSRCVYEWLPVSNLNISFTNKTTMPDVRGVIEWVSRSAASESTISNM